MTTAAGCSARATAGCRTKAGHVARDGFFPVIDAATHTLYAGNTLLPQIDVFDTDTCTPAHLAACTPVAEIPSSGPRPTSTRSTMPPTRCTRATCSNRWFPIVLGSTMSVINIAHCHATDTTGCDDPQATVALEDLPGPPVLDPATHTLYLEQGVDEDSVAVIDTRHCNALDRSGCGTAPATVPVPAGSNWVDVSVAADAVYVSSYASDAVAVIDGATCNGSDHSGCGQPVGSAPAGLNANGVLVADSATAQISIVDGRTCNANTAGTCPASPPAVATPGSPQTLAVDPVTGNVYADTGIGSFVCCGGSASLSVFKLP